MPFINSFSVTAHGAIVITGNTLGLSKDTSSSDPGTEDSIGAFITTDTSLPVPAGWAGVVNLANNENVTFNWQENSSSAFLNIPAGSTILYAQLIWGGVAVSPPSPEVDVSAFIDDPVSFTTPAGTTLVSPDPATAVDIVTPGSGTWYTRSQNVTNLVAAGGAGEYITGQVPSALNPNNDQSNAAGWSLIVVYENNSLPPRNMTVFEGGELVTQNSTVDIPISGFLTPPSGPVSARILVSSQEGDATFTGDSIEFGLNVGSLTKLSGPNNPADPPDGIDNFFGSQINIGDPNDPNVGQVDTTGSFGNNNQDAFTATNTFAGRQGWDITNVDGSAAMANSQSTAILRLETFGDIYFPNGLAIQIDVAEADLSIIKTANPDPVIAGELLTYTLEINNAGPSDAQNVVLTDPTPPCILNPEYSLDGGVSWQVWTGTLNLGNIIIGDSVTVLIRGTVDPSCTGTITNTATVSSDTFDSDPSNNSSTTITDIDTSADVSIVKLAAPNPVIAGELLTYTLEINNTGPSDALNVNLADILPPEIISGEFSIDGGTTWNPWVSPYNLGTLPAGDSVTILIRGTASPAATGTITNTASVSSDTPDPDPSNNSSTIITDIDTSADVLIVKLAAPNPVVAGELLTYTLEINNAGPSDALNVNLTDILPPELTSGEFSTDGGTTWLPWVSPYAIGTLAAGDSQTILIRGTVDQTATGTITNTAEVSSTTPDPDPSNNSSTIITAIDTSADLSITKLAAPNPVVAGELLTYTLEINNAGPSDALNVNLTDLLPPEIISGEFSTDGGTTWIPWINPYAIGTLPAGDSVTILIRGTVSSAALISITNTAEVSSTTPDPDPSNNSSTIITAIDTSADLSITKLAAPNPVVAGELLTYTLEINNAGPSDALNVNLADILPPEIISGEFSTDGGTTWLPWVSPYNLGTLPAGDSQTVLIRGTANPAATGSISNTAEVSSTTPDPDPSNNSSTTITDINTSADVSIVKLAAPNPVVAGELLTYTLEINNAGPSDALNVILVDIIPAEIISGEFSIDGGTTWNPWVSPYNLGTLPAGDSQTILIRGTIDPTATGTISNTAEVSSTTPDPDPSNNSSTIITEITSSADLSIVKLAAPNPVVAGELLTYTLEINNAGPSDALNVNLADILPPEIISGEFSIDGGTTWIPWINPYAIGTLPAGDSVTILIRGTASPAATGSISNTASVSSNTPDPDPSNNSSTIITDIDTSADVSIVQMSAPNPVVAGELLTYILEINNAGPSDAQNVDLADILPPEIISGEFSTDGGTTWLPWVSPYAIGILAAGDSVTILIRGTVSPAATGSISNTASVSSTTPDPDPSNNSSTIITDINTSADVSIVKLAAPNPVIAGELLTYTLEINNAGPSDAQDVNLADILPAEIISGEFSTDGGTTWIPWFSPYNLGTLPVGDSLTILIRGTIAPTATGTISNTAEVSSTTPDPDPSNNSSSVVTQILTFADLSVSKTVSMSDATVGDLITYTIVVNNLGPLNAQNVVLDDIIPAEITGTEFSIDGGITWNPWINPYVIGTLAAGDSLTILIRGTISDSAIGTVRNTATVTSTTPDHDPSNNTSTVDINILIADLEVEKFVDKDVVKVGDTLTYTAIIKNNGNTNADNVVFKDQIPIGTTFVDESVSINGTPKPSEDPNSGISLGSIPPGDTVMVSFNVNVESRPAPPLITNTSLVDYSFIVNDTRPPVRSSTLSNEVTSRVEIVKIEVVKTADKTSVLIGDIITYTVRITNSGTITVENLFFTDTVPNGTTYIPGSLTPVAGDPNAGVNLGDILPNESIIVTFMVKVDFVPCPLLILNEAIVEYEYSLAQEITSDSTTSNTVNIDVLGPINFKQLFVNENLKIPCQKPDAEEISNVIVDIEILRAYPIKTIKSTSLEGQNLTGNKLVVEGFLKQKIEYIATDEVQSLHVAEFKTPFSSFIVLPEEYKDGTDIEVEGIIEDVYTQLIDKRTIFKNVTFMLIAKLKC